MNTKEFIKMTDRFIRTEKMPLLFAGHGSPMNAIEENDFVKGWREAAKTLPRPHAVLCISAHWETRGTYVTSMERPITIHDFGGFPRQLYTVEYPAPGSPALAEEARQAVTKTDVEFEKKWGLDHGCWSVLRHMYPEADVPIVELSLDHNQGPRYHYELAKELAPLRRKGVLIVGSGNMVHNLGMVDWKKLSTPGSAYPWALEASEKLKGFILDGNHARLIDYKSQGTAIHLAVPTPEHYLPLLYVLGLKEDGEKVSFFNDEPVGGSLTMTCVRIEPGNN